MKRIVTCLAAGLLVIGAQSLQAQSTNTTPGAATATPGEKTHHEMTPEQRKALMKLLGLTRADLKDLSPQERHTKMKDAAEKVLADLKTKKEAGTLTDEDKTNLELVHKFLAGGHKKAAAAPTAPAEAPANN